MCEGSCAWARVRGLVCVSSCAWARVWAHVRGLLCEDSLGTFMRDHLCENSYKLIHFQIVMLKVKKKNKYQYSQYLFKGYTLPLAFYPFLPLKHKDRKIYLQTVINIEIRKKNGGKY